MELILGFFKMLGVEGTVILVLTLSLGVSGWYIKHQRGLLDELRVAQASYKDINEKLADRLEKQNSDLKAGEDKYKEAQTKLNVAQGVNVALTKEYANLRKEWQNRPLPTTCEGAVLELKNTISPAAAKWNQSK